MEVRIGPKAFRSELPMGFVNGSVADAIEDASSGRLGKQTMDFNIRVSGYNKFQEAYYERAYLINGHCRFKRYGAMDVVKYKFGRLLNKILPS